MSEAFLTGKFNNIRSDGGGSETTATLNSITVSTADFINFTDVEIIEGITSPSSAQIIA